MIPLSIVAASVIAVAVAIFTLSSDKPRTADQRGITLQTLIVTAVLVLMAGVAGVVIIGITRGQESNLRDAGNTANQANCQPWEIFDPTLSSAGRGGTTGTGGIESSAKGCVRVCYLRIVNPQTDAALADASLLVLFDDDRASAEALAGSEPFHASLEFSRTDQQTANETMTDPKVFQVAGIRHVDIDDDVDDSTTLVDITGFNIGDTAQNTVDRYEIRVSTDNRSCIVWNTNDNDEAFRSQGTL